MQFDKLLRVDVCRIASLRRLHIEKRIESLGLVIPSRPVPKGNYINCIRVGNTLQVCGHIPLTLEGSLLTGRIGETMSIEEGYNAARMTGLNICSSLKSELGDLDKVKRIVKLFGVINCTDSFTDHPAVLNGCSDLLVEVFGDKGKHSRTAVGKNVLPLGIPLEIDAVVELESD